MCMYVCNKNIKTSLVSHLANFPCIFFLSFNLSDFNLLGIKKKAPHTHLSNFPL